MFDDLYTVFLSFLDSIFYDGYAEQLAAENPEAFSQEWQEFADNHRK